MDKCPQCGYSPSTSLVKPFKSAMHSYVHKDGKPFGILNEHENEVTLTDEKKTVVVREDYYQKLAADAARAKVVTTVPPATAKPVVTPTK